MLISCYALGLDPSTSSPIETSDFGIGLEQLTAMTRDNNLSALEQYGGVRKSFINFYPLLSIMLTGSTSLHLSG